MKIYGIDLGTCMSSIAHVDEHEEAQVLLNDDSEPLTNSVVWFESDKNTIVGELAYDNSGACGDEIVLHVKSKMGRLDEDENPVIIKVAGRELMPEEVSARILKEIVRYANARVDEDVTDVVITVPAYFGAAENKATKDAGRIAGLTVHSTLAEPIAAALAYGFSNPSEEKTLLVYDLGGGTFDVTLFKLAPPESGNKIPAIEMITTGGNNALGGVDWDNRIRDYVVEEFLKEFTNAGDPREEIDDYQTLYIDCEKAKKALSKLESVKIGARFGGNSCSVELTRDKLKELTSDLLDQTETEIELLFNNVQQRHESDPKKYPRITPEDVDNVILAGGSTRLVMVQEMLEKRFPGKIVDRKHVDPDQCVSLGAAWYGWLITQEGEEKPKAVAANSIGVLAKVPGEKESKVCPLIIKDEDLPFEKTDKNFVTEREGDTSITVRIFQNQASSENDLLREEQSTYLGKVVISDLPPGRPKGQQVEVTLKLDESSQLDVRAKDIATGKDAKATINIGSGLDEDDVIQAMKTLASEEVRG